MPAAVIKRDGTTAPFDAGRIRNAIKKAILAVEPLARGAPDRIAAEFSDRAVRVLGSRFGCGGRLPGVDDVQQAVLQVLHEDARKPEDALTRDPLRLWECYLFYSKGRGLVREGLLADGHFASTKAFQREVRRSIEWGQRWSCGTVEQLNGWYRGDNGRDLRQLIMAAEEERMRAIKEVAASINQEIRERDIRLIVICGPSSSGKTTTIRASLELLSRFVPDLKFQGIEVDNYFRDWSEYEKHVYEVDGEKVADYDYEKPQAYKTDLLNAHLEALLAGREVLLPEYDFREGRSYPDRKPFRLEEGSRLLLDCMHGIHPMVSEAVPREKKMIFYTEAMSMIKDAEGGYIRWTDIRLMRRALRDAAQRGVRTIANFWHWWLVRQGEAEMLPFTGTADIVLNGGHPCELPVYKHYLHHKLKTCILPVLERNPDLFDGLARAKRIIALLEASETATPEQISIVPAYSVMREFIGGSVWFGA